MTPGMPTHASFDVAEVSRVGEARRHAARLTADLGFDDVAAGRVALVVTELGNNLVQHAGGGRLLVGGVADGDRQAVEVLSLDTGRGMADAASSLVDGRSTGGTPGTGLGAVRRLSQLFDLYSRCPGGTVVVARLTADGRPLADDGPVSLGAVRIPAPGELVCGDNWCVATADGEVRLMVADGLGHGPQAMEAADAAMGVLADRPAGPPARVLERVHEVLRTTRGAAVAMVAARPDEHRLTFAGIGNVAGRILSGVDDRTLMSQHGTAGVQVRRVADVAYDWPAHAVVVLHSDGFTSRWQLGEARDVLQHHPAVVAGWIARDQIRGRDDATLVVMRRKDTR